MLRLRSWASSRMIVSYWRSSRSRRDLGEQDAVGHQLDQGGVAHLVGEAHLEPDGLAQRGVQLLGDALGDAARGDPPRLGVPDPATDAAAELEGDLRQLGRLPRAGLPRHHHDLGFAQGGRDVVPPGADRQVLGVADRRDGRPPPGDARLGRRDVGDDPLPLALPRLRIADRAEAVEPPSQPVPVLEGEVGQPRPEVVVRGGHGRSRGPLGIREMSPPSGNLPRIPPLRTELPPVTDPTVE